MSDGPRATLRRLAVILDDSNDAITIVDLKGKILAWNKGASKLYGYTEEEALQMNVLQLIPHEQQPEWDNYKNIFRQGETSTTFEAQRISKSGRLLDILMTASILTDDDGGTTSLATTEKDITHIKEELRTKEKEVKKLKGLLPICASCKEIRDDQGYWHQIESYIRDHSEAEFSHGICPKCIKKLYPEYSTEEGE